MDWYSLPLSVRKLFFATGDHYRKPQSIKMQIRGIQSQWIYIYIIPVPKTQTALQKRE